MKPRKKILIVVAGVITALLLITNSFVRLNQTAGISQSGQDKKEHSSPALFLLQ